MSAIEQYDPDAADRLWARWEKTSKVLANSSLCPPALKGRPDDVLAVAITAHEIGMELTLSTLNQFHVIEGKVEASAQLKVALAGRAGHEMWFTESSDKVATVNIRKHGSTREQSFTYTVEMARRAGLLDEWWECWMAAVSGKKFKKVHVVKDGEPLPAWVTSNSEAVKKRKENWHRYPEAMLMARAATRAIRAVCPEVLLGLETLAPDLPDEDRPARPANVTEDGEIITATIPDHPEFDVDQDDDIVDAIIEPTPPAVEGEGATGTTPPRDAAEALSPSPAGGKKFASEPTGPPHGPTPADEWDRQSFQREVDSFRGSEWWEQARRLLRESGVRPPGDPGLTQEECNLATLALGPLVDERKNTWRTRQRYSNAALSSAGIKADEDRWATIAAATGGSTNSTGELTAEQCDQIVAHCDQLVADAEAAEAARSAYAEAERAEASAGDDHDPGRPFDQ